MWPVEAPILLPGAAFECMEMKVKLNESPQTDNTLSTLISSAEQAAAYEGIAKNQCPFLPPKAPK